MAAFREIVADQRALLDAINKIADNARKEGSRRTVSYIDEKVKIINQYWSDFQKNNEQLRSHNDMDLASPYFTEDLYHCMDELVTATISKLQEYKNRLYSTTAPKTAPSQGAIPKINNPQQEGNLGDMLQQLLQQQNDNKKTDDQQSNINVQILQQLNAMQQHAIALQQQLEQRGNGNTTSRVRLPVIDLPKFDGKYEHWTSFKNLFCSLIHEDRSLSGAQKLHYLKGCVSGEAEHQIRSLEVTDNNYDQAWLMLNNRYDNKRLAINKYIDKLLHLPVATKHNAVSLRALLDSASEYIDSLQRLGQPTQHWNAIVVHLVVKALDHESRQQWELHVEQYHQATDYPSFEILTSFIKSRSRGLESSDAYRSAERGEKKSEIFNKKKTVLLAADNKQQTCKVCTGAHHLQKCEKFLSMTTQDRLHKVKTLKLCINCMRPGHVLLKCSSRGCLKCQKKHNTLLHHEQTITPKVEETPTTSASINTSMDNSDVLLATALIKVRTIDDDYVTIRALIDQGSQATLITESAAALLKLPQENSNVSITGIGKTVAGRCLAKINLKFKSRFDSSFSTCCEALILPKLTRALPATTSFKHRMAMDKDIKEHLADPTFSKPGPIDIIFGADIYCEIILNGLRKIENGLVAQRTELGWILSGKSATHCKNQTQPPSIVSCISLQEQLAEFFEIEELPSAPPQSKEDAICEEFFTKTFKREQDGKFTVSIPFKSSPENIGESRSRALARLFQIEKKFTINKELEQAYKQCMLEYLSLNHMKLVKTNPDALKNYYIPHQAVVKNDNGITKVRVVFDASSKTKNGISLNSLMHTGPRLQNDLPTILLKWRKHQFVFSSDIEKMYRQINISDYDQQFHRILWRWSPNEPVQEYQLTTVTFGTSAAPYLALRTIQQLAKEEESEFKEAAQILVEDTYVDDILTGADSLKDARLIQQQLISLLKKGGFSLHKWAGNHSLLLTNLEPKSIQKGHLVFQESIKTLGIHWLPEADIFKFEVNMSQMTVPTKRTILSDIARLFDPLGWLAPVIVQAKLMMQHLWINNSGWDDPISQDVREQWVKFRTNLSLVEKITVPRWTHYTKKNYGIELHGFCDASEKAYGAVIYSRITSTSGQVFITLLQAKSKIAPIKMKKTLPRLELCAALLLAKLFKIVSTALKFNKCLNYAWSDSMIALSWINGRPDKWQNFVANRVAEIQALTKEVTWNHIRSQDNPADILSRGIDPDKLKDFKLWWNGPAWLTEANNTWPKSDVMMQQTPLELKVPRQIYHSAISPIFAADVFTKYSSITKLCRIIAYCKRFKKTDTNRNKTLQAAELSSALETVIKIMQETEFGSEMDKIRNNQSIRNSSSLISLNPFLDDHGILRVGGRLTNATIPFEEKHPIILPQNHHITTMIINDAHLQVLHGGYQLTVAFLRRKYWIIKATRTIKKVLRTCVKCFRFTTPNTTQIMGDLPTVRVTPSKPFTNTGVDYAGPIKIRTSKGRGIKSYKGYICIFVCMATKALHVEAVSDMSSDAFIAAFKRFTARRGHCLHIYSDNGTTFVGADKQLKQEFTAAINESLDLKNHLARIGTHWHFIPPGAPHFGGIWEAGVKSIKHHLKRIIGESTLTFEELSTVLYQIEACLNSRPLTLMPDDPSATTALTPAHFLVGKALVAPPETMLSDAPTLGIRWKLVQKMYKDFWKIWSTEYLNRLQQRYKWQTTTPNVRVGDVVILREDNIPPTGWPLAKIEEIFTGSDGKIRVVTLKCRNNSILKRPITRICPLPISDNIEPQETIRKRKILMTTSVLIKTAKMNPWLTLLIFLGLVLTALGQPSYEVVYPSPGIYVESMGHSKIQRGHFRIDLQFPLTLLEEDKNNTMVVFNRMKSLCMVEETRGDTHCKPLLSLLNDQRNEIIEQINKVYDYIQPKKKRGLFGHLLNAIFGVNDEIYADVDTLNRNQQALLHNMNQQQLLVNARINNTNEVIENKLKQFDLKIKKSIEALNEMRAAWYTIDHNRLEIHILASYTAANHYLSDIHRRYKKLLLAIYHKASILDFLSVDNMHEITHNATRKLASNLIISDRPEERMETATTPDALFLYGYFHIMEATNFDLIHVTPIPKYISENKFMAPDVPLPTIAINFDTQSYFMMTELELAACTTIAASTRLCTPTIVSNIEANPHCIIDELYERTPKLDCNLIEVNILNTVWKQLRMPNTWLFISAQSFQTAIICNGQRVDITLNNTGIIKINTECFIKTKLNILRPLIYGEIKVASSFNKSISFKPTQEVHKQLKPIANEPILKHNDQLFAISQEVEPTNLSPYYPHVTTTITSIILTLILVLVILIGYKYGKRILHHVREPTLASRENVHTEV